MTRLLSASCAGALVAAMLAWRIEGAAGTGILAGYLLGAASSGLAALYQCHVLRTRPQAVMGAVAVGFLTKLAFLVMGALTFRYVEAAALRADWRSFLIAFAAAVALIMPLGAMDAAASARRARARREADAQTRGPDSGHGVLLQERRV